MLTNLRALKHRPPLAHTGPLVVVDQSGQFCPITLGELEEHSQAWQAEIVDHRGVVKREAHHFYELAALATWLANHDATPFRNPVTQTDRRNCVLAANVQLARQGEPLLPVPAFGVPPPPGQIETRALDFELEGYELGGRLFEFYDTLDANDRYLAADELKLVQLKRWIADNCQSARAVYSLWHATAWELEELQRLPPELPELELPEPTYTTQQGDSIFRRIAGHIANYKATAEAKQNYRQLLEARTKKSELMALAARSHGAAVCNPQVLPTRQPVTVHLTNGYLTPQAWAEGIESSEPDVETALRAFDEDVRRRSEVKAAEYGRARAAIHRKRAEYARRMARSYGAGAAAASAAAVVTAGVLAAGGMR